MSGPCWAHVGPMLGHVGPMLDQCWAKNGVFIWALALCFWVMSGPCWGPKPWYLRPLVSKNTVFTVFLHRMMQKHWYLMVFTHFLDYCNKGLPSPSLFFLLSLSLPRPYSLSFSFLSLLLLLPSTSSPPPSLSLFLSPPLPRPYSLSFSFLSLLLPSTSSPPPPLPRYDVELAVNKVFLEKSYKVPGVCVCVCLPSTPSSLSLWPSLSLSFSLSLFSASPIQAGPGSRVAGAAHTQQGCQFLYGPNQGAPCSIDSEGAHGFGPMLGVVVNCQETHTRSIRVEHRGTFHTQF